VPEIVQQRGSERVGFGLVIETQLDRQHVLHLAQAREQPHHDVCGTDAMSEARVLRAGKNQRREAQLAHVAQTLQLTRIEQRRDHALVRAFERHQAMNRIA